MAKRNKAKFAAKSRKSALRVEVLEQRQLLAAVTGGGTEVGSNIVHPNGNVYDQVLMTGASVTVTADAGQVTRVSFLDLSGDIVQAEFSGAGSLTISLDQFKGAAAEAPNYNQPGIKYVQGLASFTIQGENSTTNFSAFSVGSGNAINQTLFAGGKTGGNHLADVARLLIVADPAAPGGSTMGGIRMGNAVFADTAGVVGISAANVQTQGPVIIGDIDASNAGVPTLKFGTNSQFATLTVAGGDLVQTNGQTFAGNITGFSSVNSTAGADSTVESRPGFTLGAPNLTSKVISTATVPGVTVVTLDSTSTFDLTGKSQADIDAAFKGRTFTTDITIGGDLSGVNNISAAEFRGAVTFTGALSGNVTVDGAVKSLSFAKASNSSTVVSAASIGSITTTGTADLAGTVSAKSIGAVTVGGNLAGTITTDTDNSSSWTSGEKSVGDVTVTGNFSGSVTGVLGIGNVNVGGDVTSGGTSLRTLSGSTGDAFVANIGKVTVTGDVRQSGSLINIGGNGTFGDITILGGGTNTSSHTVGSITVAGKLGADGTAAGKITVTDNTASGSTLTLGAISIGGSTAANGSLGAITVTNSGSVATGTIAFTGTGSVGDIKLTGGSTAGSATLGAITLSTGGTSGVTLGNVSLAGVKTLTVGAIQAGNIGNIDATASAGTGNGVISTSSITGANSMGNLTLNASTVSGSTVTIGGNITTANTASNSSGTIGTVSLTAGSNLATNISIGGNIQAGKIGAVTHTGTTTFSANMGYKALGGLTSFTTTDSTVFSTVGASVDATATSSGTAFALTGGGVTLANVSVSSGGGTNYTTAPTVTLTGGTTTGTAATAAAVLTNGVVTSIEITNAGTGYTVAPTGFTLSGGAHTSSTTQGSATPNIQVGGTSGAFTFGGSTSFTGGLGVTTLTGAVPTQAAATTGTTAAGNVAGGVLQSTVAAAANSGVYTVGNGPTYVVSGGTGTGGAATAIVDATSGQVTGFTLSGGTGYVAGDVLTLTPTANTGTLRIVTSAGTTNAGGTVPAILANNGGSALDSIASLTFNGTVTGVAGAGTVEVRASSIGDISVSKALATNESLVTNFNVYAGNNGASTAGSAEKVAVDGSNLSSYKIGNISITSTNTIGVSGTALLSGSNSFNAIGQIGNVTLTAGGSSAVQSSLFQGTTGNSLVVQTGNGNISGNVVSTFGSGIDFDGNGSLTSGGTTNGFDSNIAGTTETGSVFSTSSTVSIGNVSINAKLAGTVTDSVAGAGQTSATEGLVILSGVKATTNFDTGNLAAISSVLRGTVGNVMATNLSQQLSVSTQTTLGGLTSPNAAAVIAATGGGVTTTPYGTINGVSTSGLTAAGAYLVGTNGGTTGTADNLIVVRL